ncbi:uncharacterized protein [Antedon mediterranea]|uniref:uncharacterized protein n=1 Tax=Antedon mediterranea TaxID=105859 RepID=UPI003AF420EC
MMPQGIPWSLCILILVVPIQYFLTTWKPVTDLQRRDSLHQLAWKFENWRTKAFDVFLWKKWIVQKYKQIVNLLEGKTRASYGDENDDAGESPAVEVLNLLKANGHFAGSPDPRIKRPAEVKFRIGQVIRHKLWGYRGIIVGWDETAQAPESWIQEMHPKDKPHWRNMPNYSILVDTRDVSSAAVTTYIPQENIELIGNMKIIHPDVDDYFEGFDGTRYLARPWLKHVYPHDQ